MERALVIGASGGIGSAICSELQARGADVTGLSRSTHGLDVTQEDSIADCLAPLKPPFDLVFVATGALDIAGHRPEKTLRALSGQGFADQFAVNCIGPALVLKHAVRLLPRRDRSVFAALSARVGSIGDNRLGGWYAYRAAKAALNQVMHGAAIELRRSHPKAVLALLHPGTVETRFTERSQSSHPTVPAQTSAKNMLAVLEQLGPEATGSFHDYAGQEIQW